MPDSPPTTKSQYASAILRAVEQAQNDSTQLRSLIYGVARLTLGRHILENYPQLGATALLQMQELEAAIAQVELLAQHSDDLSAKREILDPLAKTPIRNSLTIYDPSGLTMGDNEPPALFSAIVSTPTLLTTPSFETWPDDGQAPDALQPPDLWKSTFGQRQTNLPWHLSVAAVAGAALCALFVVLVSPLSSRTPITLVTQPAPAVSMPPEVPTASLNARFGPLLSASADTDKMLGFALPTVYGVYAVSEGTLYELDPLPIGVPDARVAISAMISSPSHVTLPNGSLSFVIFRRDLVSTAPTEAFVRIVARVEREMKFTAGRPTTVKLEGQWAVRSKSYTYRVAPVGSNPEMVLLHSQDPQLTLSPGRYALVIAGQGFDFTVAGNIVDTAECLERTEVVGGSLYSECRTLP